ALQPDEMQREVDARGNPGARPHGPVVHEDAIADDFAVAANRAELLEMLVVGRRGPAFQQACARGEHCTGTDRDQSNVAVSRADACEPLYDRFLSTRVGMQ